LTLCIPGVWLGQSPLSLLDGIFTATSAVCVTGLIVVDTAQFSRFGQLVIMLLIQLGGLGIVSFAMIYTSKRRRISFVNRAIIKDLFIDEIEYNPKKIIKSIILTTLVVEGLCGLLLFLRFRSLHVEHPLFTGLFHAVSAFCNAGFSTFSVNLENYRGDWFVNLTIMLLIIVGGIGFAVIKDVSAVFSRRKRHLSFHTRIVLAMTMALLVLGTLFFYVAEYDHAYDGFTVPEKLLAAFFQSVTPRTAGFDTVAPALLGLPSILIVIFLMFTGGSPGSTAGGIKTTTLFTALVLAWRGNERDGSVAWKGARLNAAILSRTLLIIVRSLVIVAVAVVGLVIFEFPKGSAGFVDLLFETVSAFATVGLSCGITAGLGIAGKSILIATMFAGRVGIFAMIVSQIKDSPDRFTEYPDETLMLG